MSPPEAAKIDDLFHSIQAWENREQRHRDRTGDQLPKDMRLAILLSMCPTDLEKELTAQQHLFSDYAQMKARIVTVINSRTRGLAPMMMGDLSDEDSNHHASSDESVEVLRHTEILTLFDDDTSSIRDDSKNLGDCQPNHNTRPPHDRER